RPPPPASGTRPRWRRARAGSASGTVSPDGGGGSLTRRLDEGSMIESDVRDVIQMIGRDAFRAAIVARLRSSSYVGQPTPLDVPCDRTDVAKAGLPAEARGGVGWWSRGGSNP